MINNKKFKEKVNDHNFNSQFLHNIFVKFIMIPQKKVKLDKTFILYFLLVFYV